IAWERMQYVADTKQQALTWLNLTGDDRLVRLAIEDFDNSRVPFGLTQARYPAYLEQFTASYSLYWASMVHDYWIYRGDDEFTRRFLPGIGGVLGWWQQQMKTTPEDQPVTYSRSPVPITDRFVFALTLKESAELFEHFGQNDQAAHYRELAEKINRETYASHFDTQSGFVRDTPKLGATQEVNALAVLSDAVPRDAQRELLERMLADPNVKPGPARFMFFRFELGRALKKTGLGDRFVQTLGPWNDMIRDGMTTLAEFPQHSRSDCHPWAASPAYEFLSTIAGIEPGSPGFKTARIEPSLGTLQHVHARMPHPLGPIEVWLDRSGEGLHAHVVLPPGLTGVFVWKGREQPVSGTADFKF
ncbi:MAG: alpha-L-rhamnosidase C-terminal domain-containing protein, partial [Terracidiphilus sp.]